MSLWFAKCCSSPLIHICSASQLPGTRNEFFFFFASRDLYTSAARCSFLSADPRSSPCTAVFRFFSRKTRDHSLSFLREMIPGIVPAPSMMLRYEASPVTSGHSCSVYLQGRCSRSSPPLVEWVCFAVLPPIYSTPLFFTSRTRISYPKLSSTDPQFRLCTSLSTCVAVRFFSRDPCCFLLPFLANSAPLFVGFLPVLRKRLKTVPTVFFSFRFPASRPTRRRSRCKRAGPSPNSPPAITLFLSVF